MFRDTIDQPTTMPKPLPLAISRLNDQHLRNRSFLVRKCSYMNSRAITRGHAAHFRNLLRGSKPSSRLAAASCGRAHLRTHGNAKATYESPDFLWSFPPPQAITTYCFPSTAYTLGVAKPATGRSPSHSSCPVRLL